MDELIREMMRERLCHAALLLYAGADVSSVAEDLDEIARENWAFRSEDDA